MKHIEFFEAFLKTEVRLNPNRRERLDRHVRAVSEFLSKILPSFQSMERQGSYALGTIIKPVNDGQEFDADVLVYMKNTRGKSPKDYINELHACLKANRNYADKLRRRTRCVTIDYAGDFHLDLVPCIVKSKGKQFVCNWETNNFEPTDGTSYQEWFSRKVALTHGNLKGVTQLLKYMRDHKHNFAVKSILLTTLIGNLVKGKADGKNFKTVPDALMVMSNRLNDYLQSHQRMPKVKNPALASETFTRHWTQGNYANFRKQFKVYNDKVNAAYNSRNRNESIDRWRSLFGEEFGRKTR